MKAYANRAGTRSPRAEKPGNAIEARELELFIENDGRLYEQQWKPILKNLANKKAQGKYDRDKAIKLFMYLMESGAKKYAAEVAGEPSSWSRMFDVPTRKLAAKSLVENFEHFYKEGAYDEYLTKVSAKAKAMNPNRAGATFPDPRSFIPEKTLLANRSYDMTNAKEAKMARSLVAASMSSQSWQEGYGLILDPSPAKAFVKRHQAMIDRMLSSYASPSEVAGLMLRGIAHNTYETKPLAKQAAMLRDTGKF